MALNKQRFFSHFGIEKQKRLFYLTVGILWAMSAVFLFFESRFKSL